MKFIRFCAIWVGLIHTSLGYSNLLHKLKLSFKNYDDELLRNEFKMEHNFNKKIEIQNFEDSIKQNKDLQKENQKEKSENQKNISEQNNIISSKNKESKKEKIDFGYGGDSQNYSSHKRLQMEKNVHIDDFTCNKDFMKSFGLEGMELPIMKRNKLCPNIHRTCCSSEDITKSMESWMNKDRYFVEKYYETYLLSIQYLIGWEAEVRKLAVAFRPTGKTNHQIGDRKLESKGNTHLFII